MTVQGDEDFQDVRQNCRFFVRRDCDGVEGVWVPGRALSMWSAGPTPAPRGSTPWPGARGRKRETDRDSGQQGQQGQRAWVIKVYTNRSRAINGGATGP